LGRKPRLDIPGGLYHVTVRGNYQQKIFNSDADRRCYLEFLAYYQKEFTFDCYAFCLMDNHVHLLIQRPRHKSLGEIMQRLNARYSININKKSERVGHLFQGRYHAILVQTDPYLLELTRYIHLNPVRAGLVSHPKDYQWSSCRAYLKLDYLPFLNLSVLESLGRRPGTQIKRYAAFLEEGMKHKINPLCDVVENRFLGSENFIKEVKNLLE
jgi:REP element-mobilizing transposase RayT